MKNSETRESITLLIVQRILVFPFIVGITFIGAMVWFIRWNINFIRFGGETIAYTRKMSRKTIQDVFTKLIEIQQTKEKEL